MVWPNKPNRDEDEELEVVHVKPLKRKGLSKFYAAKSKSFSSLGLAVSSSFGDSAMALGKASSAGLSPPTSDNSSESSSSAFDEGICSAFVALMHISHKNSHSHRPQYAAPEHSRSECPTSTDLQLSPSALARSSMRDPYSLRLGHHHANSRMGHNLYSHRRQLSDPMTRGLCPR
eukprot:gene7376-500_t